jgi:hypothetical protein
MHAGRLCFAYHPAAEAAGGREGALGEQRVADRKILMLHQSGRVAQDLSGQAVARKVFSRRIQGAAHARDRARKGTQEEEPTPAEVTSPCNIIPRNYRSYLIADPYGKKQGIRLADARRVDREQAEGQRGLLENPAGARSLQALDAPRTLSLGPGESPSTT